ncbi:MAG TPA: biotin/lipoate A/B protein ligase family protein [Syntrophales bacterium]|nr:biotin/lipoate A/B protein ligase family protein [Syntrophales bacterium]HQN78420.1 biotin/lipoate A/B protein ligase family protein [Syntrophales bacterium]
MEPWRLLPFRSGDPFENMAVDEALFRIQERRRMPPTLRFFGWTVRTVSLGYFQDTRREVDLEACRASGVPVVRRPTGGKAVIHDRDLCYSVTGRSELPEFSGGLMPTYRLIGRCLARGLAGAGVAVSMPGDEEDAEGAAGRDAFCFASASRYELLVGGRKICGSAQSRSRNAFLQQGSVLIHFDGDLPSRFLRRTPGVLPGAAGNLGDHVTSLSGEGVRGMDGEGLAARLLAGFEEVLGVPVKEGTLTEEEASLARELREGKYGSDAWNVEGRGREWMSAR